MKLLPICFIALVFTSSCAKIRSFDFNKNIVDIITSGDTNTFNKLLSDGYDINAPLGDEHDVCENVTVIFYAWTPQMFDYLVANGADPHHQELSGKMPIDILYKREDYDLVSHIATHYPYSNTNNVCGYPLRLLQYIFNSEEMAFDTIYISINNKRPDPELMNWLQGKNENVYAYSIDDKSGAVSAGNAFYSKSEWYEYRYKSDKDLVSFLNINIEQISEKEWSFSASHSFGMLSGTYKEGAYRYIDKYKQWIVILKQVLISKGVRGSRIYAGIGARRGHPLAAPPAFRQTIQENDSFCNLLCINMLKKES
jgi:hypothetical protein